MQNELAANGTAFKKTSNLKNQNLANKENASKMDASLFELDPEIESLFGTKSMAELDLDTIGDKPWKQPGNLNMSIIKIKD